jgi:hypothetical protein
VGTQSITFRFSIQVKVSCPLDPRDQLTDSNIAYHGAGILIWENDQHFLPVERNAYRFQRRTLLNCFPPMIEYNAPGESPLPRVPNAGKLVFNEHHTWLRLSRRGDTISGAMSHDGENWQDIPTLEVNFPPRVRVGVHAINNSKNELNVGFSELTLKQQ